ncbi:MAG: hypothetical protein EXR71_17800 [Myxococcales bacterium]|nr:hypothetical protein [Myxococcales bacterium]
MIPVLLMVALWSASPFASEPSLLTPMTPTPVLTFSDGPVWSDPGVVAWLEGSQRAMLRVPVVVQFGDEFRLGIGGAWLGDSDGNAPEGAVLLTLDDSQMGVALLDHLRKHCPPGPRCAVLIEGMWGPALSGMPPLPGADAGPKRHPVTVRRFVGLQSAPAGRVGIAR